MAASKYCSALLEYNDGADLLLGWHTKSQPSPCAMAAPAVRTELLASEQ